jgi:hypothetical protein
LTLAPILLLGILGGCAGNFDEVHYFMTVDPKTSQPINYFRLTVDGGAGATNARYISGFYDERAVDLFLNESKATTIGDVTLLVNPTVCKDAKDPADCANKRKIWLETVPTVTNADGSTFSNGAFVLILSSNANAIADTIGTFAENQANLEAMLFALHHDKINESTMSTVTSGYVTASRDATMATIDQLLVAAAADGLADKDRRRLYLAAVNAAARGIGRGSDFADADAARAWFAGPDAQVQP